ncbi:hypothetical protein SprV_0200581100 [Sparganum proliferum]
MVGVKVRIRVKVAFRFPIPGYQLRSNRSSKRQRLNKPVPVSPPFSSNHQPGYLNFANPCKNFQVSCSNVEDTGKSTVKVGDGSSRSLRLEGHVEEVKEKEEKGKEGEEKEEEEEEEEEKEEEEEEEEEEEKKEEKEKVEDEEEIVR